MVKSAGNENGKQGHAGGTIRAGETTTIGLKVSDNPPENDSFEIWCDGEDRLAVAIRAPSGETTPFVVDEELVKVTTAYGNDITIDIDRNADLSGHTQTTVFLRPGSKSKVASGDWKLLLRGDAIVNGRYDVWIQKTIPPKGVTPTRFPATFAIAERTVTIPGSARRVITVGSYVTRRREPPSPHIVEEGMVAFSSSHGSVGEIVVKPELVAPGEVIVSSVPPRADAHGHIVNLGPDGGTSMAAPHVAGVAALILSVQPGAAV